MGCCPQHLTTTEQASAKRERDKKYHSTPHAKAVRAAAPRPPQHRQQSVKVAILGLQPPSKLVLRLCQFLLLDTRPAYQEAHCRQINAAILNELNKWRLEPPFPHNFNEPPNAPNPWSNAYHLHTQHLLFVLHGDRMQELHQWDIELRMAFETDQEAAMEKLPAEVLELMEAFERVVTLGELYHPYDWAWEWSMWELYMQWQVHTIYHLYYLKFLD
ncbi:hypothetical protein DFH08DRAFT_962202 [Mycena albidolilacea]|uniref:Uncharacterized protein n=1 Tax=Mycena albidolilacea TaxID=1033008 RepID=A0AAD6ZYE5_9AGAR|nr:hypothetical protein DFH08DRAFT_962202 [Mycena albidolilacea]